MHHVYSNVYSTWNTRGVFAGLCSPNLLTELIMSFDNGRILKSKTYVHVSIYLNISPIKGIASFGVIFLDLDEELLFYIPMFL